VRAASAVQVLAVRGSCAVVRKDHHGGDRAAAGVVSTRKGQLARRGVDSSNHPSHIGVAELAVIIVIVRSTIQLTPRELGKRLRIQCMNFKELLSAIGAQVQIPLRLRRAACFVVTLDNCAAIVGRGRIVRREVRRRISVRRHDRKITIPSVGRGQRLGIGVVSQGIRVTVVNGEANRGDDGSRLKAEFEDRS